MHPARPSYQSSIVALVMRFRAFFRGQFTSIRLNPTRLYSKRVYTVRGLTLLPADDEPRDESQEYISTEHDTITENNTISLDLR